MNQSQITHFLGLAISSSFLLTPIQALAANFQFDYSKVENFSVRPIESDHVLTFSGNLSDNEGVITAYNLDPTAPDAGHLPISINGLGFAGYYTTGRQGTPLPDGSTRTGSLSETTGFSNFVNYLNDNGIALSEIGYAGGQKEGLDYRQAWSLGEDKLGQDWFASPDSPVEERIYRADPDNMEFSLFLGTTKIVSFGYSDIFFVVDNGESPDFTDNFNVTLFEPVPASKVEGLDPLFSGAADAFLMDVAIGGGFVQLVSEEPNLTAEFAEFEGYGINTAGFPFTLSAVSSPAVPEKSSVVSLLLLAGGAILYSRKKSVR